VEGMHTHVATVTDVPNELTRGEFVRLVTSVARVTYPGNCTSQ